MHRDRLVAVKEEFNLNTPQDWIDFRTNMPEGDLDWFEWQANEFAGRLLIPRDRLIHELNKLSDKVATFREVFSEGNDEELIDHLGGAVARIFQVSEAAIVKRIRFEGLWGLLSFNVS